MRRTLSRLPYLPEKISFVDESLVSSASADSYVSFYAPLLEVKFGLNWFTVSENQTEDLGPDPTLPSP